jgi:hypothetical protein
MGNGVARETPNIYFSVGSKNQGYVQLHAVVINGAVSVFFLQMWLYLLSVLSYKIL